MYELLCLIFEKQVARMNNVHALEAAFMFFNDMD